MGSAPLDFYVTIRSPFSYLAAPRVVQLARAPGVRLRFRPVYPLAIRAPDFFVSGPPQLLSYLRRDAERVAEMLGHPFAWPDPDPVVQDLDTAELAAEQPHVHFLTRLLAAAETMGAGFALYQSVSALIFDGRGSWAAPGALSRAAGAAGLDFDKLERVALTEAERMDGLLAENAAHLEAAGHWGTPSLRFGGEIFFGQDRIDMCAYFIEKAGMSVQL